MSRSKQVRIPFDAWPLLEQLQSLLVERSHLPVSKAATLRYGLELAC